MTISPITLRRARKLKIIKTKEGGAVLEVYDQILKKVVERYTARTDFDIERIKRAFMQRFNVPKELVEEVDPFLEYVESDEEDD